MTDALTDLVMPARTAVVTQELQGAVVGPEAGLPMLADAARHEALPNIIRLLPAARAAGVQVVHCLVHRRRDGRGSNHNARVVLPRDAVAGVPAEYGAAVIENTLSLLATVTTTEELLRTWRP